MGVHEGMSLRHPLPPPPLAVLEPDLALPDLALLFSGMAMKEALASSGPLSTSTRASACAQENGSVVAGQLLSLEYHIANYYYEQPEGLQTISTRLRLMAPVGPKMQHKHTPKGFRSLQRLPVACVIFLLAPVGKIAAPCLRLRVDAHQTLEQPLRGALAGFCLWPAAHLRTRKQTLKSNPLQLRAPA